MTESAPEPMAIQATVSVAAHIDVLVEGPAGLTASVRIPDDEAAYDALDGFVAALPQAVEAALVDAEERANA